MAQINTAEYDDVKLEHSFCYGNARASSREYQRRYRDRKQSNRHAFATLRLICVKMGNPDTITCWLRQMQREKRRGSVASQHISQRPVLKHR
jgi:hypothetical protein